MAAPIQPKVHTLNDNLCGGDNEKYIIAKADNYLVLDDEFIFKNKVKYGDIAYFYESEESNPDIYFFGKNINYPKLCKYNKSELKPKLYNIDELDFINDIPVTYYSDLWQTYYIYTDVSDYMDQIKANFKLYDFTTLIVGDSRFTHKTGNTYQIFFTANKGQVNNYQQFKDQNKILEIISKGYFMINRDFGDMLMINSVLLNKTNKLLEN